MYYHNLQKFVDLISNGEINPSFPIPLMSIDHNTTHNISFLDHCKHLCNQHDTNILRLLSVIQQKLNGDMIIRLNKSPVFNSKVQGVINEWGENIEPMDIFRCPNQCYDCNQINEIKQLIENSDSELNNLNQNLDEESSGLYESLEKLKNNYHDYGDLLNKNLLEIEERRNEYNPKYIDILTDMSTKPKSFYMDTLLDKESDKDMIDNLNLRIIKGIPENVHVIFLNTTLIPNMISKCMEGQKSECLKLKAMVEDKEGKIETMMSRIGPSIPLSDTLVEILSGIQNYFQENDDDLPTDDEDDDDEEDDESKIKGVLDKLVTKRDDSSEDKININSEELDNEDGEEGDEEEDDDDDEEDDEEDDEDDDEEEKDTYYLKIEPDSQLDKEDSNEIKSNKQDEDSDNISFF